MHAVKLVPMCLVVAGLRGRGGLLCAILQCMDRRLLYLTHVQANPIRIGMPDRGPDGVERGKVLMEFPTIMHAMCAFCVMESHSFSSGGVYGATDEKMFMLPNPSHKSSHKSPEEKQAIMDHPHTAGRNAKGGLDALKKANNNKTVVGGLQLLTWVFESEREEVVTSRFIEKVVERAAIANPVFLDALIATDGSYLSVHHGFGIVGAAGPVAYGQQKLRVRCVGPPPPSLHTHMHVHSPLSSVPIQCPLPA